MSQASDFFLLLNVYGELKDEYFLERNIIKETNEYCKNKYTSSQCFDDLYTKFDNCYSKEFKKTFRVLRKSSHEVADFICADKDRTAGDYY